MLYIQNATEIRPFRWKKGAGTMHVKVGSQIFTRSAQHKSFLLQEAPGTSLKSTQGDADAVLGLRQGYCMPGSVSVYPRDRETNSTAPGALRWICGDSHTTWLCFQRLLVS